ncbi:unnamed protein product, partial [Adineta steineri]
TECRQNVDSFASYNRTKQFNTIFETGIWGSPESRSGPGSTLEGAFDWIKHLRWLFQRFNIRSMADIPCGDTYWQFSVREINTIEALYFGGDISTRVITQNRRLYGLGHNNKLFHYWDLVSCPVPTFTFKNSTHELKGKSIIFIVPVVFLRNSLKNEMQTQYYG